MSALSRLFVAGQLVILWIGVFFAVRILQHPPMETFVVSSYNHPITPEIRMHDTDMRFDVVLLAAHLGAVALTTGAALYSVGKLKVLTSDKGSKS